MTSCEDHQPLYNGPCKTCGHPVPQARTLEDQARAWRIAYDAVRAKGYQGLGDALEALSAQQAAGEAEAVGYLLDGEWCSVADMTKVKYPEAHKIVALYATPQPTETQRIVAWRNLALEAIALVESACRETNWGQPTFGPSFAEELAAKADAIEAGEHLAGEGQ